MDKLDLDARLARLERRVGLLSAVLLLGVVLTLGLFALRASSQQQATLTPLPPSAPAVVAPVMPRMAVPSPVSIGMMENMGGMMGGIDGSVPALHQKLISMKQLHDEGLIAEEEWKAMKAKALEEPLASGDLRSELQIIQQMLDDGLIDDTERVELRDKLLRIGK